MQYLPPTLGYLEANVVSICQIGSLGPMCGGLARRTYHRLWAIWRPMYPQSTRLGLQDQGVEDKCAVPITDSGLFGGQCSLNLPDWVARTKVWRTSS